MKNILLFLSVYIILFTACQHKKNDTPPISSVELQPLRLGMMTTLDGLPFYMAKQQGVYDSLGLDLNIIQFNSANDRDAAFQAGQIDGMITDYTSAAILESRYHDISLIMRTEGYSCFIVSKESRIKRLQELPRHNVAISHNTTVEYATDQILKKIGISPDVVNLPEIAPISLRLQMLQYGQVDASFLPEPYASIAMKGGHKSLISTQELGINFIGTAFSRKSISEKRKEIKLLITGYNVGVDYIQKHPQKEWEQVLVELGVPENITGIIALPSYSQASRPSAKDVGEAIRWLKEKHRIPDQYSETHLIDTTYIHSQNISQ